MPDAARKSTQIQIRVSPIAKAAIERAARRAGMDMSAYVLSRVLPARTGRFAEMVDACRDATGVRFALAELNEWLAKLAGPELREAVAAPPPHNLAPYVANYVAAMVEYACARRALAPPSWTRAIPPLAEPVFGSTLASLRLHLLTHSPAPFRRRNLFIDSSVGARV
jgi:uncharacterized protein (DUF1778 family)